MQRLRVIALVLVLATLLLGGRAFPPQRLLVVASTASAATQDPPSDRELRRKQRRQEREQEFLREHSDSSGRLRPDLWQQGIADFKKMRIAAGLRLSSRAEEAAPEGLGGVIGVQWTQIGPAPLAIDAEKNFQGAGPDSGQVVDIAIDPRNSTDRVIYIATNDGGIWRSTDGGANWQPKTDFLNSLSFGAVALDPGNPSIVYAGTGNLFNNGFFKGIGIYKSIDAGDTWSLVGAALNGQGINRIVLPASNTLLVATGSGLFRSIDGGVSFGNNSPSFNNGLPVLGGFISDLHLDTASPSTTVLAAVYGTGIFRSTDAGVNFTNLFTSTNGAPTANVGYIAFAQSTQPNNQTLYASVQDTRQQTTPPRPSPFPFNGLFKSTDGGGTWNRLAGADSSGNGCQCGYDQTVGVDPRDANRVYLGFQELYRSTDGGGSFSNVTANQVHFDHHALVFSPSTHVTGSAPTRFYVGTDGGIAQADTSVGGGITWTNINGAIATNLFRGIDLGRGSSTNNGFTYGGTQDTGTVEHRPSDPLFPGTTWRLGVDGDGGPVAVDPCDPMHALGNDDGGIIQTTNGGANWGGAGGFPKNSSVGVLAFDPNCTNAYAAVFTPVPGMPPTTTFQLFQSTDNGANFSAMHTFTAGVSALGTVRIDSNVLWVGLSDGTLQRTANALAGSSSTWTPMTITGAPGGQGVSAVAIDPTNTSQAVVVYPGFCSGGCAAGNRTRHVFRTTDNGATWTDISGTDGGAENLPDLPLHDVVIDPGTTPHTIMVASDAGVMRSANLGATWQVLGLGLPTVDCTSLALDANATPSLLRVGTYGRSVFELTAATVPLLAVNADPAFGNQCVGQSVTHIVQLFNVGATDLHLVSFFRLSGSADFQLISGPSTPVTIRPGEELDFTVQFLPTSAGNKTAIFQLDSDDPFQPARQLRVSGTGVTAQIATVIADGGNFGNVCVGSFKDLALTIANSGGCDLSVLGISSTSGEFQTASVMSFPLTIHAGDSLQVPIRFQPSSVGPKNAKIRVISAGLPLQEVDVSGNAPASKLATVIADAGDFGKVCVGSFKDLNLTLSNSGGCDLSVSNITSSNPEFQTASVMSFPLTIHPGDSLQVPIRFQPSSFGPNKMADIQITSNDPASPKLVKVTGTAPSATIVVPAMLDFGKACPGATSNRVLTIGNSGECELIVKSITSSSPEFKVVGIVPFPLVIPPGSTRDVMIQFMPSSFGPKMATLTIMSNDLSNPNAMVTVKGTAPPPVIQVVPDPLDFGKVCLGTFKDLPLTIKNTGECNLTVTGITSSLPEFTLVGVTFPIVIPPGGMRDVTIRFAPTSTGLKTGTLTITSDDPATPSKLVTVTGIGPVSAIQISGPTDFGSVPIGSSKLLALTISNTENCDLVITEISCESSAEFVFVGFRIFPIVIPAGTSYQLLVQFRPQNRGPRMVTITVKGHDPATPGVMLEASIKMTGVGR